MTFAQTKSDTIPLTTLPYGFQKRIIALSPLKNVDNLSQVCPQFKNIRRLRPKTYDQVFITDNNNVCRWASRNTFVFEMFKLMHQFAFLRYLIDGLDNISPVWHDVLCFDEIIDSKQHIYVEDTLILYCVSPNSYEKVIPYICGPYIRLVLHGNINVDQVVRLVHRDVKKVRINATIEMPPESYDSFAELVAKQVHGFYSSFTFIASSNLTLGFRARLKEKCRRIDRVYKEVENNIHVDTVINFFLYFVYISTIFVGVYCFMLDVPIQFLEMLNVERETEVHKFACLVIALSLISFMIVFSMLVFNNSKIVMDQIDMSVLQNNNTDNRFFVVMRSLWDFVDSVLLKIFKFFVQK